jgi:SAM-dependent methyltransferase
MWAAGDYTAVAEHLQPVSLALLDAVGIGTGDRVLDDGVGSGNTAIEAARRGAQVTGIDFSPEQLALARARADREGVTVELHEANAEALPFPDASFDAVVSVFAVIFVPDHARATAEMARLCAPGGTVALTAWAPIEDAWSWGWQRRAEQLLPTPGPVPGSPVPDAWGNADEVARRFTTAGLEPASIDVHPFAWTFPSMDAAFDFFLHKAAPFIAFQEAAAAAGVGDQVPDALRDALVAGNTATDGTCSLPAPYLLALAHPAG